ncbi:TetR/AcrR family transcriptional regulator [Kitasatospora hibisci]|uniref:TetR/AcrR family transcriptional regulator n=1 Tax=Kitasatospora hibisci TaxID=3369522 RepID=UPI003754174F
MAPTGPPDHRANPVRTARLAHKDASTIAAQPSRATGNDRSADSSATGSTGSRSTGSRRSEAARLAVLNAADDLLVEYGFEALTIEGIAAAAGVAKQTIYRWWKSKVDILFDNLVLDAGTALAWPEHPSGPADVRAYVHRFAAFLGEEPAGRVLQALLGHAQLDPRTAELLHGGFLDELRARDVAHVRTCLALADDDRAAVVLDAVLAPLYHRALVLRRPHDTAFVDALLDRQLDRQPAR